MTELRVALIVGPFRSGTSLVAQVIHRLGWQIAPTIPAPAPPSWRSDWEDYDLTLPIVRGSRPSVRWLQEYVGNRRQVALGTGFGGRIACKSPYLALIWKNLLEAVAPLGEPFVIRTFRNETERRVSLAAHPVLRDDHDKAIHEALYGITPSIEVGYEWAVEGPLRMARTLADALGVPDDGAVAAAAALVGTPTRYSNDLPDRTGR